MIAPDPGTLSEAALAKVLHDLWLRVHLRRFDGQDYPDGRPDYVSERRRVDSWYAGVQHSQHIIEEVAREHGIDRVYDEPAARLAAVPARDDLAAKVEALAEEFERSARHLRGRSRWLRQGHAARLRALLADPGPDQEQP